MTDPSTQDVQSLTAELVGIDSVNPSLVAGAAGEHAIATFVHDWSLACGLEVCTVTGPDSRPSVIVRGGARSRGRTLLLCGHTDTVGHARAGGAGPVAVLDGGRLYGRGGYDMKAGLAAALIACRDATAAGIGGQLLVAAVADEEHASTGIQAVLHRLRADAIRVDAAVVTEPTELEVAVAHKGFVWTEIEVIGRAAHGSRPQLGIDAISRTGPVLLAVDQLDRELAARPAHPLLGRSTVHASLISGGTEASTIPERCTLTIERRTLPGQSVGEVEADVARMLDRCRYDQPDLTVRTRTVLARHGLQTPEHEPIVTRMLEAAMQTDFRPRIPTGLSYWADSAFLAAAGIPTVLFGPSGDGAHAETEWVELDSVRACAQALTILARDFCG